MVTRPHMLETAEDYRTATGLHPDAEKHKIFVDLEPVCPNYSQTSVMQHSGYHC